MQIKQLVDHLSALVPAPFAGGSQPAGHQLPETGHNNLLVTQKLHRRKCSGGNPRGSVRRASCLVQTRFSSLLCFVTDAAPRLAPAIP
jgi:hypothetical protein